MPADAALDGFEELFLSERAPGFVASEAGEMFGESIDPGAGEISFVRYFPGKECVVLWAFPSPDERPRLLSATLFASRDRGEARMRRSRFQRALRLVVGSGAPDPPFRFLPERCVLLLAFPMDGKLASLPAADSERWVRSSLCPAVGISPEAVGRIERRPLSFKPWRRCVLRYRMQLPGESRGYFAKVFRDDRGEALFERASAVDRELRRRAAKWDVARPLAYLPAEKILVFEEFEGVVEVRDLLRAAPSDSHARGCLLQAFERAGEAICELQRLDIAQLPSTPPSALLARVGKRMRGIERVAPETAEVFERSLEDLARTADELESEPMVPAHGALRHDQLLMRGDRLAVLDLDGLCLGGQGADAGNLLGFLDMVGVRQLGQRELLAECEAALFDGLRCGAEISLGWIRWYRALAHLRSAVRRFLSLECSWRESVAALRDGRIARNFADSGMPPARSERPHRD